MAIKCSIREWWVQYLKVLTGPVTDLVSSKQLNKMTDHLMETGIIKEHKPMPTEGAEDLASEVDRIVKNRKSAHMAPRLGGRRR